MNLNLLQTSMSTLEDMFNEEQIDKVRGNNHNDIDSGEVCQDLFVLVKAYSVGKNFLSLRI